MMPICPDLPGLVGLSAAAACCYGPVSFARVQTKRAVHPEPVPALIALARMLGRMHNRPKLTPASISAARQNVRVSRIRQVKAATVDQLSPAARCLLRSLIDYLGESEVCWPSVATLASECGLSNRHVRRILRELELTGWILSSPRRRADGGQTSSLISWRRGAPAGDGAIVPAVSPPPDTGVRPIEDSGNTHKQHAECVLHENSSEQQDGPRTAQDGPAQPRQAQTSPGRPDSLQDGPAAPAEHPDCATADGGPVPVAFGSAAAQILQRVRTMATVATVPARASDTPPVLSPQSPAAPAIPAGARGRWIVFDPARLTDPQYLLACYDQALRGGLLVASDAARLAFVASWCEVLRRYRLGKLRNPCAALRWLLQNPKVMVAFPTAASEEKARSVLRRIAPR